MAASSRSVRSPCTKAREGALAIAPPRDAHRAIEAIWRIESARLIAGLARLVGDIGTAEELAQDALVAALEQWPTASVPDRPGAWLMATAKHRATDLIRRRRILERKYEELGRDVARVHGGEHADTAIDDEFGDDLLGLSFMACHPVLSKDARVALTLRVLGGLTTEEIARGFLVPVSSIAQRIVRAKRTLAEAHVRFEIPSGPERTARLASVLEVIYLISMRDMPRPRARIGSGPRSAKTRFVWVASWPNSSLPSRKFKGLSPSWKSTRHGSLLVSARRGNPSSCLSRIGRAGTDS
jgi:RNA polymerase sigma factor (sigma-70 family)